MNEMFDIDSIRESIIADTSQIWGITSINRREGKTYLASLLQKSLSYAGKSVLLISMDGNWESNKIKYKYEAYEQFEVAEQIAQKEIEQEHIKVLGIKKLQDLEAIIYSNQYKNFLKIAKQKYDYVIVDMMSLDARSISRKICGLCDRTIVVLTKASQKGSDVKKRIDLLMNDDVKIKGIILNDYSEKKAILKI